MTSMKAMLGMAYPHRKHKKGAKPSSSGHTEGDRKKPHPKSMALKKRC